MRLRWFMAAAAVVAGVVGSMFAGGEQAAAAGPAMVRVVTSMGGGTMLTDSDGRALYLYTRDERMKSNCAAACLVTWPPLVTDGMPVAGAGVTQARLGSTATIDGRTIATYNGWPLYYYNQDSALGDMKGQNVGNVWFVVSPEGGPRQNGAAVRTMTSPLGTILSDASGRALYMYTRDTYMHTNCYGGCALQWPPVASIGPGKAEMGADPNLVSFVRREDGSTQLTYKGWPLYYYAPDAKPGDLLGQTSGNVWYVMTPAGDIDFRSVPVAGAAAPAGATPAALPRTGGTVPGSLVALSGLAGALITAGGFWLRRRGA